MKGSVQKIRGTGLSFKRSDSPLMQVRMRITSSGCGFFGLISCSFLMSVNFSNNLIFAMTFLLAGIAMVGWYHTRSNVNGLIVADWRSASVFAGQDAVYRLSVENCSKRNRHGLLATSEGSVDAVEQHLVGGEQRELTVKRAASRRGRLASVPTHIRSCFPLGIFQARMFAGQLPECLVYPAPVGEQPLSDRPVGREAHLVSESGTFTDMRRYAPGDPMSHINWKAMARFDELYTKEFDGGEGRPALWLRWDDVRAHEIEQKLSQLCLWVLEAHKQNREYGLEISGQEIEPANDESHLQCCLRALALYGEGESEA
ncbi:MAG: hypothetical protein ACI9A1_001045 [Lentimonas sp.]|jgi:uncharacterized protein (DUF58 family)